MSRSQSNYGLIISSLIFVFSLASEPGLAAPAKAEKTKCDASAALQITSANIVAAPRGDKQLILINFASHQEAVAGTKRKCVLEETAKQVVAERVKAKKPADSIQQIDAILAIVQNMDEYNRPNYGGMQKLGTVSFRLKENRWQVSSSEFE